MNHVEITGLDVDIPGWSESCRRFTEKILEKIGLDGWEVSVAFCSDVYMKSLNATYRHIAAPTDVLSFSQGDGETPAGTTIAGDIVISLDTLAAQAKEFEVAETEELKRLIIHGILHLNGMDHDTNNPDEAMLQLQESLLIEVGDDIF